MTRLDVLIGQTDDGEPYAVEPHRSPNAVRIIAAPSGATSAASERSPQRGGTADILLRPGEILVVHGLDGPLAVRLGRPALRIDLHVERADALPCQFVRPEARLHEGFSGPAVGYSIALDDATAAEFATVLRMPCGTACNIADSHQVLLRVEEELQMVDRYSSCAVSAAVIELIVLIAREADGVSVRSDVIEALDTYLLDHTDHRVTLAELAHVSGLNASYLSRRFKEVYGEPPTARHMRIRLECAAELLREGSRVADAAQRCGFRSVHHFSTAFHRHFGTAPSGFRAGHRARSAR